MTPEQHNDIMTELRAIRAALESKPRAVATAPSAPAGSADVPLPVTRIENAGDVEVHFGKNKGVALKALGAKSVAWYAAEKPPQLKNDGTPFAMRPADAHLQQAARTVHHFPAMVSPIQIMQPDSVLDETIPF